MTAAELAARHPFLYHLTHRQNIAGIRACGLLSASALLTRYATSPGERRRVETERRQNSVRLDDDAGNCAVISDNAPISMKALANCLDHGLTPQDWLRALNRRIFFLGG